MPTKERRKYVRRLFVKAIRYYLPASHIGESEVVHGDTASIDISEGGLGMITDYPLKEDDMLVFKSEIKVINIIATSAVVKWAKAVKKNKYRVGLEFSGKH